MTHGLWEFCVQTGTGTFGASKKPQLQPVSPSRPIVSCRQSPRVPYLRPAPRHDASGERLPIGGKRPGARACRGSSRALAVLITPSLMILPVIVVPEIMFGPVMAAGFPSNVKTNFIPVPVDTLRALPTASIDILSGVSERTVCGFRRLPVSDRNRRCARTRSSWLTSCRRVDPFPKCRLTSYRLVKR